jgi:hypothetical protein
MSDVISRRTLLRGAGVAIGLPLLEAMRPLRLLASTHAARPPVRLAFLYVPGGVNMNEWMPRGEGAAYELSPTLSPLQPLKGEILVLSGVNARKGEQGNNGHDLGCGPWLSSAPIGRNDRGGYATDVSVDQIAARALADRIRLPSLELGCDKSNERIHTSNISWRAPGSPMGKEVNPRSVFARLFGDPQGDRHRRSVLDLVQAEAREVRNRLGSEDRGKLDEYLDSLRSVEKRIQFAERDAQKRPPPRMDLPPGVPDDYREHVRLLGDLAVLGFQADATRVVTFMLSNEAGRASWLDLGIREHHHDLAHHDPRTEEGQEKLRKLQKIDQAHVSMFAAMLEKMRTAREGEGTLLDHSMVLYGSGLEWGRKHNRENLPLILAGRGGGTIKPGRHLKLGGAPFSNLHLSLLDRMGVRLERIADGTGRIDALSA